MASEEDKRRLRERFRKQLRHAVSHEEELRRRQAAKARAAERIDRDEPGWRGEPDAETFAKMRRGGRARRHRELGGAAPPGLPRATVTAVHQGRIELDFAPARVAQRLLLDPDCRLVVGDEVLCEGTDGPRRAVALLPRRTRLARPDPGNPHRELLLAANVDVAVIVAAVRDPPLRPGLIDRFLLALQRGGVAPLLCVNKVDLLDARGLAELAATLAPYAGLDVPAVLCSAAAGLGLGELRERLRARTCVFVGHSGVGKSSLLNALDPAGARAVAAVHAGSGQGRHTTAGSRLCDLGDGTRVIDTPGIRAFGFERLLLAELRAAFPDLAAFASGCRFADCTHAHEPGCAVREAVAAGRLAAARLGSWLRLLGEVDDGER